MHKFPSRIYNDQSDYATDYFAELNLAARTVPAESLRNAAKLLADTVDTGGRIFSCGNGGSAAIANHLVCDCLKGIRTSTAIQPKVHSLSTTVELITAIGNDFNFDEIFSYQLESVGEPGDLLIAISSSGASPNIVRALTCARQRGIASLAMVGFSGGRAAELADVALWVQSDNYGIVEDLHQSLMHILAQFLRQGNLTDNGLVEQIRF